MKKTKVTLHFVKQCRIIIEIAMNYFLYLWRGIEVL